MQSESNNAEDLSHIDITVRNNQRRNDDDDALSEQSLTIT